MAGSLRATQQTVSTPYSNLAVYTSTPATPPNPPTPTLLLLHGNSSSSLIFRPIFASALADRHQIIAFDLPGHGRSSDAAAADVVDSVSVGEAYTHEGYARAAIAVLDALHVEDVVVFGWSLGGHVGIRLLPLLPPKRLRGLMITGTPATPREQVQVGFYLDLTSAPPMLKHLTPEVQEWFAHMVAGEPYEPWMLEDVRRTDGRARRIMGEAWKGGVGLDEKEVLEGNRDVLVAVVNGGAEQFIKLDYVRSVQYGNLWKGKCMELDGLGHAPFWEQPDEFVKVLGSFMAEFTALQFSPWI